jgi:hypothetical protein
MSYLNTLKNWASRGDVILVKLGNNGYGVFPDVSGLSEDDPNAPPCGICDSIVCCNLIWNVTSAKWISMCHSCLNNIYPKKPKINDSI